MQPSPTLDSNAPMAILMVQPSCFGFNEETAANNYFQQQLLIASPQESALEEFTAFVALLRLHDIAVHTVLDTVHPRTPDAVFPNNWISFHEGGTVVLYPMYAKNRRAERKQSVLDAVEKFVDVHARIDLTHFEHAGKFLEGTGSMVLDRVNKIAYACLSERTDAEVMDIFCKKIGYTSVLFEAADRRGNKIYHTNVLMCVADRYVVICMDAVQGDASKQALIHLFTEQGKEVLSISFDQMEHFCGNMLQVTNSCNKPILVMSDQAYANLGDELVYTLSAYNPIVHSNLHTIETLGGGSARCMLAEIYF